MGCFIDPDRSKAKKVIGLTLKECTVKEAVFPPTCGCTIFLPIPITVASMPMKVICSIIIIIYTGLLRPGPRQLFTIELEHRQAAFLLGALGANHI